MSETDLFGRFHLTIPGGRRFDGYYASLDAIRPLVSGEHWRNSVTGFYINVTGDLNAVRLSCFTATPEIVRDVVESFVDKQELQHCQSPEVPSPSTVSQGYGGEELRFRRFLATYTLVGLEIMQADLFNARCLLATFRWQVMLARKPYKPHFSQTFESQSPFYRSLPEMEKDQFLKDLSNWPNPRQVDWAHLLVNMILGCDWVGCWDYFLSQKPPLSIARINELVKEQGFQIPDDWRP